MRRMSLLPMLVLVAAFSTSPCRAHTVVESLVKSDSFGGLNASQLAAVAALCTVTTHKAGDEIITYGAPVNRLFVVQTGKARHARWYAQEAVQRQPTVEGYRLLGSTCRLLDDEAAAEAAFAEARKLESSRPRSQQDRPQP